MKRYKSLISIMLSFALLFSCLTACTQKPTDLSSLYNQTDSELDLNSNLNSNTISQGGNQNNNSQGNAQQGNNQNSTKPNNTVTSNNGNTGNNNNTNSNSVGGATNFSELDKLVKSIPKGYDAYVKTSTRNTITRLVNSANSLDRENATQQQVNNLVSELKQVINKPQYNISDISTVYITYDKAPVNDGNYVSAGVTVIDHKGGLDTIVSDSAAQIRIRGNTTALFEKLPYNIRFSEKQNLFGMGDDSGWYLLANAFDKTLMRNAIALSFSSSIGVKYCVEYRYVDLYVNGQYRGNYMITEKVEANKDRIDIDIDNGDFLIEITEKDGGDITYMTTKTLKARFEVNEPKKPNAGQKGKLQKILDDADAAISSGNINEMKKYIDMDSFVNFYIANEYLKMLDFHYSSPRFYVKGGKVYAGPVWDFDLSMGNANGNFAPYADYMNGNGLGASYKGLWCNRAFPWYVALMKNGEFKKLVKQRYNQLQPQIVNVYETNELGQSLVDRIYNENKASFNRNFTTAGWKFVESGMFENAPKPTLIANVDDLRNWLKNRNKWLLEEFNSY